MGEEQKSDGPKSVGALTPQFKDKKSVDFGASPSINDINALEQELLDREGQKSEQSKHSQQIQPPRPLIEEEEKIEARGKPKSSPNVGLDLKLHSVKEELEEDSFGDLEMDAPESDGVVRRFDHFQSHRAKQRMPKGKTLYLFCDNA